jgi:SpoVK/Ycf46/Vps4 family AAA+-type ATPase
MTLDNTAMSGTEPSDSIRVVNALLTQLDQIRKYPNVIILTTSNITEAIDLAFVDRADVKQYIGLPSSEARFYILQSCARELVRTGIVLSPKDDAFNVDWTFAQMSEDRKDVSMRV